jgi:hypothetical protein
MFCIRALSAHSAAEFNILHGRWQHVWLVAIVPVKRWGEMDRNDYYAAWGNFKTFFLRYVSIIFLFYFFIFIGVIFIFVT